MQTKPFVAVLMFLIVVGLATAAGQPGARIVRISDVEGQVDFYPGRGYDRAAMNMPVTQGNRLITRDDGWAEIQFEDGSVMRLAPNTDVVFSQLARSHEGATLTQIDLNQGEAEFEVNYHRNPGELFQVNAGQKAVVLHQTGRFRLASSNSDPLFLAVWSGEVDVRDLDSGGEVAVKGNETFALNASDAGLYDLESGITSDGLDQWSSDRDDYLSKYSADNDSQPSSYPSVVGDINQYVLVYDDGDYYDRDCDCKRHRDHDGDGGHRRITGGGPGPVPPPVWGGRKIGPPEISPGTVTGGGVPPVRKIGPPEISPGPVAGGQMPPTRKIGPPETSPGPSGNGDLPPIRKIGPPEGSPGAVAVGTMPPIRKIGPPDQQVNTGLSNGGSGQGFRNRPPEQLPTVTNSFTGASPHPMGINPPPPQPVRTYTPPEPPARSYNPPPPQQTYSPPPEPARTSSPPPTPVRSSSPPPAPPQTQSSPSKSSSSQAQNTDSSGKVKK